MSVAQMIHIEGLFWSKAYMPLRTVPICVEEGIQFSHQSMDALRQELSTALQRFFQETEQDRKFQRVSSE
jgi:hypothetical protein